MESKIRILVIDDEQQIRKLLRVALTGHGYEVTEAASGQDGLNEIALSKPDIVILDMGLPDIDGINVVRQTREWSKVPIIILSVKELESDKICALDAGADDYVTKPFSMGELLARIRTALRHSPIIGEAPRMIFDDLCIDLAHRRVTVDDRDVKMTPTEYELIRHLAINAGKVLTHKYLLRTIWGISYENDTHYLRVYTGQLRRKIEKNPADPRHIITEPGVGYRLL